MLQINDGSAKEATLIGLSRFDDYEAKISMCNSQGCGPNSGPLVLRGLWIYFHVYNLFLIRVKFSPQDWNEADVSSVSPLLERMTKG